MMALRHRCSHFSERKSLGISSQNLITDSVLSPVSPTSSPKREPCPLRGGRRSPLSVARPPKTPALSTLTSPSSNSTRSAREPSDSPNGPDSYSDIEASGRSGLSADEGKSHEPPQTQKIARFFVMSSPALREGGGGRQFWLREWVV